MAQQLEFLAGNVELMNALMRFHDEAQSVGDWSGLRVGMDSVHDLVMVWVRWPHPSGEVWLELESGLTTEETLLNQADLEECTMGKDDAARLADAAQELFLVSALARRSIDHAQAQLNSVGLSRDQVANPASVVFHDNAGKIASWERAQQLEAALEPSKPSRSAAPRM